MARTCNKGLLKWVGGFTGVGLSAAMLSGAPQSPQSGLATSPKVDNEVTTTYHQDRDATTVGRRILLVDTPEHKIDLSAEAEYKGRSVTGVPREVTLIFASLSNGFRFPSFSLLSFLVDNRQLPARRAVRLVADSKDGVFVEAIAAILPSEMFAEIARGSTLELTLDKLVVKFTSAQMAALSALALALHFQDPASRSSVGESAKTPADPQRNSSTAVVDGEKSGRRRGLNQQMVALYQRGELKEAAAIGQELIEATATEVGSEGSGMAVTLNNVAVIYKSLGDYAEAEKLYRRVLEILNKLGPEFSESLLAGVTLDNLGLVLLARADHDAAIDVTSRAVTILERSAGPNHPDFATALNNLGNLYGARGERERAIPLLERALQVMQRVKGPEHPDVATILDNLAIAYSGFAQSETYSLRALSIYERVLGNNHPEVGKVLFNLARDYNMRAEYAKSEPLLQRALQIYRGVEHPELAKVLLSLSDAREGQGDPKSAIALSKEALAAQERMLSIMMTGGSEKQKRTYLTGIAEDVDSIVSLHTQSAPSDPDALALAFTTILQRKGRALEAASRESSGLRQRLNQDDREVFDATVRARALLAAKLLADAKSSTIDDYGRDVRAVQADVERLEGELSRRSARFRAEQQPVTLDTVQAALPRDAVLIEYVRYRPNNPRTSRYELQRFAAYVVRSVGEPQWVDLGSAALIEYDVAELLAALASPKRTDVKVLARSVDKRLLAPLRPLIGRATRLFISPDAVLSFLPFAALVDESGRYATQGLNISYLTTGRDLLRLVPETSVGRVTIVANPDFEHPPAPGIPINSTTSGPGSPSRSLTDIKFARLPGTAAEANRLRALFPGALVLTDDAASELAVKTLSTPRILHIATHGFFLKSPVTASLPERRGLTSVSANIPPTDVNSALMRSGLVLAGANSHQAASGEDGFLTALELMSLDLHGTELVVLSACETGIGDIHQGEGVYGLRRALVLAGSKSQVISMWRVDDRATLDLMVSFYENLRAGLGRADALREAQLRMLANPARQHPFYWASFIQSGDWRPLSFE